MTSQLLHFIHDYRHDRYRSILKPVVDVSRRISALRLRALQPFFLPESPILPEPGTAQSPPEIRLFVVARNEALRLKEFIEYHLALGVDRIFLIDNASTDTSLEIARTFSQVHIFQTAESYIAHMNWVDLLLSRYGLGHWCLLLDVDEFFGYPQQELLSLPQFCQYLEQEQVTALPCLMLDMYSAHSLCETHYCENESLFSVAPYFDPGFQQLSGKHLDRRHWKMTPLTTFIGGPRQRVFGIPSWIGKVPLFRYSADMVIGRGSHDVIGTEKSALQGVLFHFKFLSDFVSRVESECKRNVHYANATEYNRYWEKVETNPTLGLICPESVRFRDTTQLSSLGCMRVNDEFMEYVRERTSRA